jgi:amino acid adenylation domain-containing protein
MTGDPKAGEPRLTPVDHDPFSGETAPIVLPLTDAQQEVWVAAQMGAEASLVYNECIPLRLVGPLSLPSLDAALQRLASRHEALRATFAADGEKQFVAPVGHIPLIFSDASSLDAQARDRAIGAAIEAQRGTPFDLANGPLARVHLVREAETSHVLVFAVHHLVCDGWSFAILLRELGALYTADRHGIEALLPDPMSYREFVQQASERPAEREKSEAFWIRQFAGAAPTLDLPTDRPRPRSKSYRGSHTFLQIDAARYAALKRSGARHGCSMYVVLLAAWQTLMHRLTAQSDVVVGIPVAAQTSLENTNLVGHCVQMLPLRTAVDPHASIAAQLRAAREALVRAFEHQTVTFGRVVGAMGSVRDASRTPLLATVFNVDRAGAAPHFVGLIVERLVAARLAVNFDLGLDIADSGADLAVECMYNADLFDASTIVRWLDAYRLLLDSFASNPETAIAHAPILTAGERERLERWGEPSATFPVRCLHEQFEAQAARTPDAIAVRCAEVTLTYAALNARANRLARHLRTLDVGRDVLVGLWMDRSADLLVAILGSLKAGGAYLPIEPAYPAERVRFMLQDARPPVVITTAAMRESLPATAAAVVAIDAEPALERYSDENVSSGVSPRHLAYVIYTSGSTGQPKGTAVEHRQVSRLFAATKPWFEFSDRDVWTLFHSPAFDFSVWEIWGALLHGGRLIVVPYLMSRSPGEFLSLLCREQVTVLNQTPSAFRQLIAADADQPPAPLSLRTVIFGGEALEPASLRPWIDRYGDDHPALVNMYGITETTVHVTYRRLRAADVRGGSASVIGVPIPDLSIRLLSPDGELVPIGVAGEIFVGGGGVARGYLARPELTRQRFVSDPSSKEDGRMYRSGDLARWLPCGELEYLGRVDDQVKIRGFRVELGEIVAALDSHPAVRECTVVLDRSGEPRLVAYVVATGAPAPAELRAHAAERLPQYMIPAAFVFLDRLPVTTNGKLDRASLPAAGTRAAAAGGDPPSTPTERTIAALWSRVLRIDSPGVTDNFFELGGHSVLAVRIVTGIRETFAVDLPVSVMFHSPTIAALGAIVDSLSLAGAGLAASGDREELEL